MPMVNYCVKDSGTSRRSKGINIFSIPSEHVDNVLQRKWWNEETDIPEPASDLKLQLQITISTLKKGIFERKTLKLLSRNYFFRTIG